MNVGNAENVVIAGNVIRAFLTRSRCSMFKVLRPIEPSVAGYAGDHGVPGVVPHGY
jgi:hypothetical protein